MTQLRRLDASVYSKASAAALAVGIVSVLIMGIGMSLCMTDIGAVLGTVPAMVIGIVIGVVGILLACLAYPNYICIQTVRKSRHQPQRVLRKLC